MNVTKNYLETKILTASPEQLIVIMYEEAIKALLIAGKAIEQSDDKKANEQIYRAQLIIGELMASLNFNCEELSNNLLAIYANVFKQIAKASINKDIELIDSIIKLLTSLSGAWREAAKKFAIDTQYSNKALTY